jgi:hypothetical protein
MLTSSARAVGSVAVRALDSDADDLAVTVPGVIGVEVAGAAAAVGDLRSGHFVVGVRLFGLDQGFLFDVRMEFDDGKSSVS